MAVVHYRIGSLRGGIPGEYGGRAIRETLVAEARQSVPSLATVNRSWRATGCLIEPAVKDNERPIGDFVGNCRKQWLIVGIAPPQTGDSNAMAIKIKLASREAMNPLPWQLEVVAEDIDLRHAVGASKEDPFGRPRERSNPNGIA